LLRRPRQLRRSPPATLTGVSEGQAGLRIGYFVTAYTELPQLQRLLKTLLQWDPGGEIALHFDRSKATLDLGGLADERLHVLPEWSPVTWGDSSYLEVLLRGLRWWSHREVDWVVVLSGQDYPIRPADELRELFATSERNAFIWGGNLGLPPDHYRLTDLDRHRARYFAHWGKVPRVLWRQPARSVTRRALQVAKRILPGGLLVWDLPHNDRPWVGWRPIRPHPFTEEFQCCISWDYFAADQKAISILTSNEARVTRLRRWYRRTVIPTESFFITVIRGHPQLRSKPRALHYGPRTNPYDPHPLVLTQSSFDDLVASSCFFARKFDADSTPLLDRIDGELLSGFLST
jgi:hypothetical protein